MADSSPPAGQHAGHLLELPAVSDAVQAITTPITPRMRGWLHVGAAGTAAIGGTALVSVAGASRSWQAGWSTAVYAFTVVALFSISGSYHRIRWQPRGRAVMKRLDHAMIFVFIAGSYTPIAALALGDRTGRLILLVVWLGAAAGVLLKVCWPGLTGWIGVPLYIALGWTAVLVLPDLARHTSSTALTLIIVGGVAYTIGAVAFATRWPNPFPATFGFHEVFHACTLVAATCHYLAIWLIVLS